MPKTHKRRLEPRIRRGLAANGPRFHELSGYPQISGRAGPMPNGHYAYASEAFQANASGRHCVVAKTSKSKKCKRFITPRTRRAQFATTFQKSLGYPHGRFLRSLPRFWSRPMSSSNSRAADARRRWSERSPRLNPRGFKIPLEINARRPRLGFGEIGSTFQPRQFGRSKLDNGVGIAYSRTIFEWVTARLASSQLFPVRPRTRVCGSSARSLVRLSGLSDSK